jgi:hypothetical protein
VIPEVLTQDTSARRSPDAGPQFVIEQILGDSGVTGLVVLMSLEESFEVVKVPYCARTVDLEVAQGLFDRCRAHLKIDDRDEEGSDQVGIEIVAVDGSKLLRSLDECFDLVIAEHSLNGNGLIGQDRILARSGAGSHRRCG